MIRIGLIGCGTMGTTHSAAYQTLPMCRVVAACDIRIEQAEIVQKQHEANVYTDFEEMLANEELDVIDICLPTYLHKEYAIKAMERNKHVFCEKPVALENADALELMAVAERQQVKFSVGHVLRFFPSYREAANRFTENDLGPVKLIRTSRNQAFPQWSWQGWFSDYSKSGGPFVDLLIHDIDWVLTNFGQVERVYAKSYSNSPKEQDHCIAILRLKNGAIAHLEASWAYPIGSEFKMSYELVGTKGQASYNNLADASLSLQQQTQAGFKETNFSPIALELEPYRMELLAFLEVVKNGGSEVVSGNDAYQALRVALAAKESAETGQPVWLD